MRMRMRMRYHRVIQEKLPRRPCCLLGSSQGLWPLATIDSPKIFPPRIGDLAGLTRALET
eukprot:6526004-Pyramimonas_sp.AAC.1